MTVNRGQFVARHLPCVLPTVALKVPIQIKFLRAIGTGAGSLALPQFAIGRRGQGSAVTICCKAVVARGLQVAYQRSVSGQYRIGGAMARILLIEDDADVRLVVEHILVDEGYEVDTAECVIRGADLLDSGPYDLVVADGRLPDGTGIELADKAAVLGIPALIITGYAFILRELARDPDRYPILLKPLRPAEILSAVRTTLEAAG